ncbi:unnamed protein product [Mytilus coruscus]|uniref:STAS domain-containing protein n=1 Tax=Mytilus coruscus TaxID=42192 RepID=A0A6J8DN33_MYTCO|nr:unnamed protein product [Mytilus coruscus]
MVVSERSLQIQNAEQRIISVLGTFASGRSPRISQRVVKLTGIDPVKARKKQKQFNQVETNISPTDVTENCDLTLQLESKMSEKFVDGVEIVILDFSGVNFIDIVGIKALKRVCTDYNSIGIQVYIASCNDTVTSMMTSTDFMKNYEETVYLTVNCILTHKKLRSGLHV